MALLMDNARDSTQEIQSNASLAYIVPPATKQVASVGFYSEIYILVLCYSEYRSKTVERIGIKMRDIKVKKAALGEDQIYPASGVLLSVCLGEDDAETDVIPFLDLSSTDLELHMYVIRILVLLSGQCNFSLQTLFYRYGDLCSEMFITVHRNRASVGYPCITSLRIDEGAVQSIACASTCI